MSSSLVDLQECDRWRCTESGEKAESNHGYDNIQKEKASNCLIGMVRRPHSFPLIVRSSKSRIPAAEINALALCTVSISTCHTYVPQQL